MATRFLVEGRVQGVGYRAWAAAEARARGLRGFVRNLPDGRVEVVVDGSTEATDAFLAACRRGPQHADVRAVGIEPWPDVAIDGFAVLRD